MARAVYDPSKHHGLCKTGKKVRDKARCPNCKKLTGCNGWYWCDRCMELGYPLISIRKAARLLRESPFAGTGWLEVST